MTEDVAECFDGGLQRWLDEIRLGDARSVGGRRAAVVANAKGPPT
ncbi:hypothetical protein [Actinomadura fibrosa]|uniref:Uncharacterized protein n=1 Tax=Actinomadura fibrosa TaxID=111802 RepID=A0ABW2XDA5_9ACTN|nr:hypothetical protein [Actinomadura fibrosa]